MAWFAARDRMSPARGASARLMTRSCARARSGEAATAHRTSDLDTAPPMHKVATRSGPSAKPRRDRSATVRRTRSDVDDVWAGECRITAAPPRVRWLLCRYDPGLRPTPYHHLV